MRPLNRREKILSAAVVVVAIVFAGSRLHLLANHKAEATQERLIQIQRQIQAEKEKETLTAKSKPETTSAFTGAKAADAKLTLSLLEDLTLPPESTNVKIAQIERTGEQTFRMVIEGSFSEMMKFLGFLERKEGGFQVTSLEMVRARETMGKEGISPSGRDVRSIIELAKKEG